MCDRLVNGVPIPDGIGLQFVAAVNPYRQHSDEMIKKLEKAGVNVIKLSFFVTDDEAKHVRMSLATISSLVLYLRLRWLHQSIPFGHAPAFLTNIRQI
jgi:hypothetical protein